MPIPRTGQRAFRGNARKALIKAQTGLTEITNFINGHPNWPVLMIPLVSIKLVARLQEQITESLEAEVP